ncbi:MAG: pyridoxal-phosphate dependent enzyme [Steroidobacteraceae bacterium]
MSQDPLTLTLIRAARRRIADHVHETPVMSSRTLDAECGFTVSFKCENLQKTGAFKARGATNAVLELGAAQAARGVLTHSSGNHAAALARAASLRGIPAHIVMPRNSPLAKQEAVRRYGGQITLCEPGQAAREAAAAELQRRTGAVMVHPYDDHRVMAGQGTTALEFLEQVPDLEALVCPIGGGGHLAGIAVAAKALNPRLLVIGAEPAGADDAVLSFRAGRVIPCPEPRSIADGLLATVGHLTLPQIMRYVDDIVTVNDAGIIAAMRRIWSVLKLVVEPSGCVGFAALDKMTSLRAGSRIGIVLTGGNLDLDRLPWQAASHA